ncbi:MAG: hypothetical protein K2L34_01355 [Muribaculaceae bacterium]|nr:hypothetical protein [Muribaculaceae bacterium]
MKAINFSLLLCCLFYRFIYHCLSLGNGLGEAYPGFPDREFRIMVAFLSSS